MSRCYCDSNRGTVCAYTHDRECNLNRAIDRLQAALAVSRESVKELRKKNRDLRAKLAKAESEANL